MMSYAEPTARPHSGAARVAPGVIAELEVDSDTAPSRPYTQRLRKEAVCDFFGPELLLD